MQRESKSELPLERMPIETGSRFGSGSPVESGSPARPGASIDEPATTLMAANQAAAENAPLDITVLIAVRNEAANLPKCLASLHRARTVLVVDSQSVDATASIAESMGAVVVQYQHSPGFRKKRQWAMDELDFETDWILLLDADEVVPASLWAEIDGAINSINPHSGYLIQKGFHFLGQSMRWGGFSHTAVLLIRRGRARFEQVLAVPGDTLDMEVHERIIVSGSIGKLRTPLIHEDFKGLQAYIDRHNRYSTWEAHVRRQTLDGRFSGDLDANSGPGQTASAVRQTLTPRLFGNTQERRRWVKRFAIRLPGEPWMWFFYHYVFRLGFLHGRAGLIASQIRRHYIESARAKLYELRNQTAADSTTRLDATKSR